MSRSLACLSFVCLLAATARADVPPPDTWACQNMNEGAACDLEAMPGRPLDGGAARRGTCQKSTCSRLDYAGWNRDASATPPTMQYECLKCALPGDGGTTDGPAGPIADGPAASTDTAASTQADAAAATADAGGAPASDDSGCALGGPASRRQYGPWLLAGTISALLFFARRRR